MIIGTEREASKRSRKAEKIRRGVIAAAAYMMSKDQEKKETKRW